MTQDVSSEVVHGARPGRAVIVGPTDPVIPGQIKQAFLQLTEGSAEIAGVVVPEGVGLEMLAIGGLKFAVAEGESSESLLDKIKRSRPKGMRSQFVYVRLRNLTSETRELEASLWLENEDKTAAPAAMGKGSRNASAGQPVASKVRGARVVNGNGTLPGAIRAPTRPIHKNAVVHRSGRRTAVNPSQPSSYSKGANNKVKVQAVPQLAPKHVIDALKLFLQRGAPLVASVRASVTHHARPLFAALAEDGVTLEKAIMTRTPLPRPIAESILAHLQRILDTPVPPSALAVASDASTDAAGEAK